MFTRRLMAAGAAVLALIGITPPAHAATPPPLNLPAHARVLLDGDSYTQGVGATPQTRGYAYRLGADMDWTVTVEGKGGSGYVNPTSYGAGTLADRLWQHPADAYDLVILQGSSNDQKYDSTALASAYNMTIRTVHKRYPSAKIVMVGPTNPYGNTANYATVNFKLKQYAGKYGIPFISPMDEKWFVAGDGAKYALKEGAEAGHPNNAGHDRIAELLEADLRGLK